MGAPRQDPRLGAMRHRVTVEEPLLTGDAGGGAEIAWQPVVTVWAEIQPKSGREIFESDQLGGRITHDVRLRYRAGITPRMRVAHAGRLFDIRTVTNIAERRQWLLLGCEEQTP